MASTVGIDTGGTFTDVVVGGPSGRRRVFKVPSTPAQPGDAFAAALAAVTEHVAHVHHGTTVATNTVLTRTGVPVAFVTNRGLEGLLAVGRGDRTALHALQPQREPALVDAAHTFGVQGRRDACGKPVAPFEPHEGKRLAQRVARSDAQAVAMALLHAPRAPQDERRLARALRVTRLPVSLSAALSAEPREVERATTAVLDAYVGPPLRAYLEQIAGAVPTAALSIARSDGGRMAVSVARQAPVRTLLSGPAAGVEAAAAYARLLGLPSAISFDVGGTSTDVAWIDDGVPTVEPEAHVGPWRAGVSAVAMRTVGAGGGSVIGLDPGGALCVGPASAGAAPGPAAYGMGGPLTLTDAWLLLRRMPGRVAGGTLRLDPRASQAAAAPLVRASALTRAAMLRGAVRVAAAVTAGAIRAVSAARGRDPRTATLIAFGGAGPLLACDTAAQLGVRSVLVPPDPGTLAALGTLVAPMRTDAEVACAPKDRQPTLTSYAARLRDTVREALQAQGVGAGAIGVVIEARYEGQAHALCVAFDGRWRKRFARTHRKRFGFELDAAIEAVRLRARGRSRQRSPKLGEPPATKRTAMPVRGVIQRTDVGARRPVKGPVRIEEPTATTWVPEGWSARCHGLCLWVEQDR